MMWTVINTTILFPMTYIALVLIFWFDLKRKKQLQKNSRSATLGDDLYRNELFWHKKRFVHKKTSLATLYKMYLVAAILFGLISAVVVAAINVPNDQNDHPVRDMLVRNWYPFLIACLSIQGLVRQSPAHFVHKHEEGADEHLSVAAESVEEFLHTREQLIHFPLAELHVPLGAYVTQTSAFLLNHLELRALYALQAAAKNEATQQEGETPPINDDSDGADEVPPPPPPPRPLSFLSQFSQRISSLTPYNIV